MWEKTFLFLPLVSASWAGTASFVLLCQRVGSSLPTSGSGLWINNNFCCLFSIDLRFIERVFRLDLLGLLLVLVYVWLCFCMQVIFLGDLASAPASSKSHGSSSLRGYLKNLQPLRLCALVWTKSVLAMWRVSFFFWCRDPRGCFIVTCCWCSPNDSVAELFNFFYFLFF